MVLGREEGGKREREEREEERDEDQSVSKLSKRRLFESVCDHMACRGLSMA